LRAVIHCACRQLAGQSKSAGARFPAPSAAVCPPPSNMMNMMNAMKTTNKVLGVTGRQRKADTARSGLPRRRFFSQ